MGIYSQFGMHEDCLKHLANIRKSRALILHSLAFVFAQEKTTCTSVLQTRFHQTTNIETKV